MSEEVHGQVEAAAPESASGAEGTRVAPPAGAGAQGATPAPSGAVDTPAPSPTPTVGAGGEGGQPAGAEGGIPAWGVALQRQVNEIAARQSAFEAERVVAARRAEVSGAVAGLPEELRAGYMRMRVDGMDDAEWARQLDALRGEVAAARQALERYGFHFTPPPAGPNSGAPAAATAAELAAALERAGIKPPAN